MRKIKKRYASAVGSLMYDIIYDMLDMAHAVCNVSLYLSNIDKKYWNAVKWILRYLILLPGSVHVSIIGRPC